MKFLYILIFLFNPFLFFLAEAKTNKALSPSKKNTLILQWRVSHPRNRDQIFLIFKGKSVKLISNTSSYQEDQAVRLGSFRFPMNSKMKNLKKRLNRYYIQLRKTVSVFSLIKDSRFQTSVDPHAPILYLNKEEIQSEQTYFKPLANVIYKVWETQWTCVECALYKRKKKSILRIVKKLKSNKTLKKQKISNKKIKKWETKRKVFSRDQLDCVSKGKEKIECVDPQFGIFEI